MSNNNWDKVPPKDVDFNETWNGKDKKLKIDDSISGELVEIKTNVGRYKSNIYTIKSDVNGEDIDVWGGTVLDSRMADIEKGATIKIVYLGEAPSKSGGNPVKLYDVYVATG